MIPQAHNTGFSLMRDIARWNDLPEQTRKEYLKIGLWDAYNLMIARLPADWITILKEHEDFKPLRVAYTLSAKAGHPADMVLKVTDMLSAAIVRLNGAPTDLATPG